MRRLCHQRTRWARGASLGIGAALLGTIASPLAVAQVAAAEAHGKVDFGRYGFPIASVGDLDGQLGEELLAGDIRAKDTAGKQVGRVDVWSGISGSLVRTHDGVASGEEYGQWVAALGDVDLDGVPDYGIGAPYRPNGSVTRAGVIEARSGATGALIWTFVGGAASDHVGSAFIRHDDLDGDGRAELLAVVRGNLVVVNGVGTQRFAVGTAPALPGTFASIGDLDSDGFRDIAVGSPRYSGAVGNEGQVLLYSGATGASIGSFDGTSVDDAIGSQLLALPDLDGDGVDDLAVSGRYSGNNSKVQEGMVEVRSGATFVTLWSKRGRAGSLFGIWLERAGDWNGDGVAELAATAYLGGAASAGSVEILSADTGSLRHEFAGRSTSPDEQEFGSRTAGGDFDGDGVGDLAIGIKNWWDYAPGPAYPGAVRWYLGCPAFSASYGAGWPGTLSTPSLTVTGAPALGATITLAADNSLGAATTGLLLIGAAPANLPLRGGGTQLVDALYYELIPVPAAGWSDLSTVPNDPAFCFLDIYLQMLELDPGAAGHLSLTNGLQLRIGFDL